MVKRAKGPGGLVLFSGGLDSILAVRLLQGQGIRVEAVHFTCPFYSSEWARKGAARLGIRLHEIPVDSAYFRLVARPRHGYGSQMNPCLDCKAYMLRRAERLRKRLNSARRSLRERTERLGFLATGEVVGERPLSQSRQALLAIEKAAGLAGRVVRPLSERILPPSRFEKSGLVKREGLQAIHGRSRKPQMALARGFRIREYPAPAGGCLLTDPEYARRLREHLETKGSVTWNEAELLKHGRHFRLGKARVVVGRHKADNEAILGLAKKMKLARLEVTGHPGPLTVVVPRGRLEKGVAEAAARLTVRYSDAPAGRPVRVEIRQGRTRRFLEVKAMPKSRIEGMRI